MSDMKTFEMLWDCKMCGTQKLLGKRNRHCPNCGAAQDPAWRYFPSYTDIFFIENPKFVGADVHCPACHQPNPSDAKFCVDCGADLSGATEVEGKEGIVTGMEGASGIADDVVLKKFQTEQAAIRAKARPKNRILGMPTWLVGLLALLLIAGGILAFLANSKSTTRLTVADLTWKYTINLEKYSPQNVGSWASNVPGDAYNRSCAQKIKGYNQIPDGQEQVCRQKPISEACGRIYKDNKDGSGSYTTKYCTRYVQECSMQTKYRSVPYYDSWCSYTVNRWGATDPAVSAGGPTQPPTWPTIETTGATQIGSLREKGRNENYTVSFLAPDNKTKYEYGPKTLGEYQTFALNQRWNVEQNRLGNIFWETLKRIVE